VSLEAEQTAGSKMSDFERWEKRYGAPGYLFGTAPNAFLAAQADRLRGRKTALSVADGPRTPHAHLSMVHDRAGCAAIIDAPRRQRRDG
jgi:hypothetical protein